MSIAPIDYSVDVKAPFESAISGYDMGAKVRAADLKEQQAKQMYDDMQKLAEPGAGADEFSAAIVKYPGVGKYFKEAWDIKNAAQQQNLLKDTTQVFAALHTGKPDQAVKFLANKAAAYRNDGKEDDAVELEELGQRITANPAGAKASTALAIGAIAGKEKLAEVFAKLQSEQRDTELHPSKLLEAKSKAETAAINSKFAESTAVIDLVGKKWNIEKLKNDIDISKQNLAIARVTASAAKQENAIKREQEEFKLKGMKLDRDSAIREKAATLESERLNIDNMINMGERILNTPIKHVKRATGPIASEYVLTYRDKTANFEELVKLYGNQAFMAQLPNMKGFGQLSDGDRDALKNSLQALSLRQNPTRLLENVIESQRLLLKMRKRLTASSGLPETTPDTPEVQTSPEDLDALVKKHLGGQ